MLGVLVTVSVGGPEAGLERPPESLTGRVARGRDRQQRAEDVSNDAIEVHDLTWDMMMQQAEDERRAQRRVRSECTRDVRVAVRVSVLKQARRVGAHRDACTPQRRRWP